MISTLIIDDEPYCCEALATLLERHCPEVKIAGIFQEGEAAIKGIEEANPQLVFLDIEMPRMNGFQLLEKLGNIHFGLIFTTSYDQYAIKAIRHSALDYLMKPIDREELQAAVQKAAAHLKSPIPQQLEILFQRLMPGAGALQRVALPTVEGLQMILAESIIHVRSDSNYSVVLLKGRPKIVVSRTLKEMEELLEDYPFLRVHHSHLVNLNEIERYVRGEGGYLIMSDGSNVDVSRSRKEMLLTRLRPGRID
ncbi:MAG TPA: LytTR family DNA-binding domain-containing protein [Puia sp.]|nr:LytTR family DNA-binding domain-containing protein [Puia sp.]